VCVVAHDQKFRRWATAVNVKLLLPPRQSRGSPAFASRIFLYFGYFLVGIGIGAVDLKSGLYAENGEVAARWKIWAAFALAFYGAILILVYAHHNWVDNFS
jgi:hypothetical protein